MEVLKKGCVGVNVKLLQRKLNLIDDGIFGPLTEEAVKNFQKSYKLTVDGIVGAHTWAALGVISNPRKINKIILHCAATPEGRDIKASQVRQWHLANGWSDIGYHWFIDLDGTIEKGRDESFVGAHTSGQNSNSIGICYAGGLDKDGKTPKDTRTAAQKKAIRNLLMEKHHQYPNATLHGHNEFAAKACPSFNVKSEYGTNFEKV